VSTLHPELTVQYWAAADDPPPAKPLEKAAPPPAALAPIEARVDQLVAGGMTRIAAYNRVLATADGQQAADAYYRNP
jgi:hypothetical protein